MRQWTATALALALMFAGAALADAPAESLRPVPRPDADTAPVEVTRIAPGALDEVVREVQATRAAQVVPTQVVQAGLRRGVMRSPRPPERPENLRRRTAVAAAGFRVAPLPPVAGKTGALCGDPGIQGAKLSPIAGRIRGCSVEAPVQVTAVSGVALSTPATMDCATARSLRAWVDQGVKPVVGRLGGGVARLEVAAHYSCRTRNNRAGEKVSEHGKGRAIDISAIVLRNGVALTVLHGWRSAQQAGMFKAMHRAACGTFGTVLGPNSDRYHQDHFHLDTARYRGGSYCK